MLAQDEAGLARDAEERKHYTDETLPRSRATGGFNSGDGASAAGTPLGERSTPACTDSLRGVCWYKNSKR